MRVEKRRKASSKAATEKSFVWDDSKNDLVEARVAKNKPRKTKLNMEKFIETLPTLEEVAPTPSSLPAKEPTKPRRINRKDALRLETEHFKKVLDHTSFKSSPIEAISTHIKHKFVRK
mgnify:CR=1 FL=1